MVVVFQELYSCYDCEDQVLLILLFNWYIKVSFLTPLKCHEIGCPSESIYWTFQDLEQVDSIKHSYSVGCGFEVEQEKSFTNSTKDQTSLNILAYTVLFS